MNVIPIITANEVVLSGVFEIPLLDIEVNPDLFENLNNCSPWQFQYRYLKEKKANTKPASVVFRLNNPDLSDMFPDKFCKLQINQLFMPSDIDRHSPNTKQSTSSLKEIKNFLHISLSKRQACRNIRDFIKKSLGESE